MVVKEHAARDDHVVRIDGVLFKLRSPHTAASLRNDAARSQGKRPWLCRHGRHRRRVVGDVYVPEQPLTTAVLALVASSDTESLMRCERCGSVNVRLR